jgi:hypothetical protein
MPQSGGEAGIILLRSNRRNAEGNELSVTRSVAVGARGSRNSHGRGPARCC